MPFRRRLGLLPLDLWSGIPISSSDAVFQTAASDYTNLTQLFRAQGLNQIMSLKAVLLTYLQRALTKHLFEFT